MSDVPSMADELASLEGAARALRERFVASRRQVVANLAPSLDAGDIAPLCEKAQALYAGRRRRDAIFAGLSLFSDPAWDILLDLFVADCQGRRISVTSAILASQTPPSTGLRWINRLLEDDMIRRESDPHDRRRCHLHLTETGLTLVAKAVAAA